MTLLVRNGANIDIVDADGFTASDYAIKKGNLLNFLTSIFASKTRTIFMQVTQMWPTS